MDFHHKLKQETTNHHAQIECAPLLKKIINANITFDEYQLVIKKFYGYITPCEILIHNSPYHHMLSNRDKTLLLEADLQALGIQLKNIIQCADLPTLKNYEQILGYLYVIEGSTLGGQIITKILQEKFKLSSDYGICYFNGYGKNTKLMWSEFCQALNNITEPEQQNRILKSAKLTYSTLYQWMI